MNPTPEIGLSLSSQLLLQLLVLFFQLLPPAVKELESAAEMVSAAETQSLVETKEPAEFVENEPLALGMEEVRAFSLV